MNALKRGRHKVNDTSCCFTAFLWQQQVILDVNFHLVMQYVLSSLTGYSNSDSLPVHYAARVFVHLSMCQPPCLLEPILAKCKQIRYRTVLEQYSTVDLSCVPPLGWHAYYTDKWSKSQGCVSPIKPPGGIDLLPKRQIDVACREICHANVFFSGAVGIQKRKIFFLSWVKHLNRNAFSPFFFFWCNVIHQSFRFSMLMWLETISIFSIFVALNKNDTKYSNNLKWWVLPAGLELLLLLFQMF